MSRVEQIEQAIGGLSEEEFRNLSDWFWNKDQGRWAQQIDVDSAAGRLDFLFAEGSDSTTWPSES